MRIQLVQTQDKDVNQLQRNIAKVVEPLFDSPRGQFLATISGFSTNVTATVQWEIGLQGCSVTLAFPGLETTGTSNASSMVVTGLPKGLWPVTDKWVVMPIIDSSSYSMAHALITSSGTIQVYANLAQGVFATSGTKGIPGCQVTYVRGI